MERINMEDARIRVEFLKNETNEVIKSEWFDVVSYFCTREDAECPDSFKYYIDIDIDLYERDLMYDYFNVNGHIFKQ